MPVYPAGSGHRRASACPAFPCPDAPRRARVTFTTSFTEREILAGVFFRAEVIIRSVDPESFDEVEIPIRNRIIRAESESVSTTVSKTLTRGDLDEDRDISGLPPVFIERLDRWQAFVTISPHVFGSDTKNSDVIVGSWGLLGSAVDN